MSKLMNKLNVLVSTHYLMRGIRALYKKMLYARTVGVRTNFAIDFLRCFGTLLVSFFRFFVCITYACLHLQLCLLFSVFMCWSVS